MTLPEAAAPAAPVDAPAPRRARRAPPAAAALVGLTLLAGLVLAGLTQGSPDVAPGVALRSVAGLLAGSPSDTDTAFLVHSYRLPRLVAGIACGVVLGVVGVLLQACLRNPLAEPGLLGIGQGAALVLAAQVLLGVSWGGLGRPLACFAGGLAAGAVLLAVNGRVADPLRLVLAGAALSTLLAAVTSAVLVLAPATHAQGHAAVYRYLAGSLSNLGWGDVTVLAAWSAVLLPVALLSARVLTLLQLGDDVASSLGVAVDRWRIGLLLLAVALLAPVVAVAGPLSFVALLAAHAARGLLRTADARVLLPAAALAGALLTVGADLLGRLALAPLEVPAGLWTVLVGGPVTVALLRRRVRP